MGALVIPLIVAVVIVVLALVALRRWTADRQQLDHELVADETPTLEYQVPEGQDPAVVIAALDADGYVAAPDTRDSQLVRVHCPAGLDRERARVRAVIEGVGATAIDHGAPMDTGGVRFEDEH